MRFGLVLVLSALLFVGCAQRIDVATDRKILADAQSCCADLSKLPPAVAGAPSIDFQISPESKHFDFGDGLVPFVVFAIDPAVSSSVALLSNLHTTTLEAGNLYHFRGVVPKFIFLDAQGNRLPAADQSRTAPVLLGISGQYSLSTTARVPVGASKLIIATDRTGVDRKHEECIHPGGGGRPVALTQCVTFPNGTIQLDWRGAIYGQSRLLMLGTGGA